jgi:signal transduction histidine kinase
MRATLLPSVETGIARCRIVLSVVALAAIFIDPTEPLLSHWIPLTSGHFAIDPYVLILMGTHLAYSVAVYVAMSRAWLSPAAAAAQTLWLDVAFGAAIALVTEGVTSPFYPFFAFAVMSAGLRSGFRQAVIVTAVSVALYLCLIGVSASGNVNVYIMRPAYLAITGYLVGYLGQERLELQRELRQMEAAEQRHRIARDLHDGFVQALAGINLRIEGCRRSLTKHDTDDALLELTELQASVNREYDDLRAYMRALAGIPPTRATAGGRTATTLQLTAQVSGSLELVDHVLQILRESISNIRRHAGAASASVDISTDNARLRIRIADDGVGFSGDAVPWSIVSRVKELGGEIRVAANQPRGADVSILLPQC